MSAAILGTAAVTALSLIVAAIGGGLIATWASGAGLHAPYGLWFTIIFANVLFTGFCSSI